MRMSNYPIGDFLIRIKNAALAGKKEINIESTKLIKQVANTLKDEGFLDEVNEENGKIKVRLAFHNKKPLLFDIKLVSKPGLRIYKGADDIEAMRGPFMLILSTPKGVMSSKKAIKDRIGGEVIAKIW